MTDTVHVDFDHLAEVEFLRILHWKVEEESYYTQAELEEWNIIYVNYLYLFCSADFYLFSIYLCIQSLTYI